MGKDALVGPFRLVACQVFVVGIEGVDGSRDFVLGYPPRPQNEISKVVSRPCGVERVGVMGVVKVCGCRFGCQDEFEWFVGPRG